MDYIYGKLNNKVKAVEYNGVNSDTANITIDNSDKENRTIKVDVIKTPGTLTINNTNGESVSFNGSIDKNLTIDSPTTEQYQELVTKVNDLENNKVSKITTTQKPGSIVYGRNIEGVEEGVNYRSSAQYGSDLVYRNADGRAEIKDPVNDLDIVNKQYADKADENLAKVMPTDINLRGNHLILEHDGTEIPGQKYQVLIPNWRADNDSLLTNNILEISGDSGTTILSRAEISMHDVSSGSDAYYRSDYFSLSSIHNTYKFTVNENTTNLEITGMTSTTYSTTKFIFNLNNNTSGDTRDEYVLTDKSVKTVAGNSLHGTGDIPLTSIIPTSTDLTINSVTTNGNVTVKGNLSVSGTTTTVDTETLKVKDNIIVTNSDKAQLLELSGIAINTNATDTFGIMYNPTSNTVNLGLGKIDSTGKFTYNENEGLPLAIRDSNSSFTQDHLISWSDDKNKLTDSGIDKSKVAQTDKANTFDKFQRFNNDIQVDGSIILNYPDIDIIPIFENTAGDIQFNFSRVAGGQTILEKGISNVTSTILTDKNTDRYLTNYAKLDSVNTFTADQELDIDKKLIFKDESQEDINIKHEDGGLIFFANHGSRNLLINDGTNQEILTCSSSGGNANTIKINGKQLYSANNENVVIPVVSANDTSAVSSSHQLNSITITKDGKSARYSIPNNRMIQRLHITSSLATETGTLTLKADNIAGLTNLLDVDMGYNWQYDMDSVNLTNLFQKDCGKIDILNCNLANEYILQFGDTSLNVYHTNRYTLWGRKKSIEDSDIGTTQIWDLYLDVSGDCQINQTGTGNINYEELK